MEKDCDNIVLFCEDVLGIKLTYYQKEILKIMARKENICLTVPRHNRYVNLEALKLMNRIIKKEVLY